LGIVIREIVSLDHATQNALSLILTRVVNAGASVGFLAPLTLERAHAYWGTVTRPGVILHLAVATTCVGEVAETQNGVTETIVGTAQLHLAAQENGRHRAEVVKVLVDPDWQRRGVARALLAGLEARARSCGRTTLVLDTREGDPSNELYRTSGWTQVGRIAEYCISNDGTLGATNVYAKWLSASQVTEQGAPENRQTTPALLR
jgi:ribosomal protein S18 acetylase RimI-like enzyme